MERQNKQLEILELIINTDSQKSPPTWESISLVKSLLIEWSKLVFAMQATVVFVFTQAAILKGGQLLLEQN